MTLFQYLTCFKAFDISYKDNPSGSTVLWCPCTKMWTRFGIQSWHAGKSPNNQCDCLRTAEPHVAVSNRLQSFPYIMERLCKWIYCVLVSRYKDVDLLRYYSLMAVVVVNRPMLLPLTFRAPILRYPTGLKVVSIWYQHNTSRSAALWFLGTKMWNYFVYSQLKAVDVVGLTTKKHRVMARQGMLPPFPSHIHSSCALTIWE